MIQVQIKTNTTRKSVTTDVTNTPASLFNEHNISTAQASVNLNGTILSAGDLNTSFADLGVQDGSTVNLNNIVKADGAMYL